MFLLTIPKKDVYWNAMPTYLMTNVDVYHIIIQTFPQYGIKLQNVIILHYNAYLN